MRGRRRVGGRSPLVIVPRRSRGRDEAAPGVGLKRSRPRRFSCRPRSIPIVCRIDVLAHVHRIVENSADHENAPVEAADEKVPGPADTSTA